VAQARPDRASRAQAARDGALDDEKLEEIKGEAKERVQEAVRFADESEEPPIEELYTDVYAGADEYLGEE
jgi:pyruvate dehydrogenase E1 component alpha subunit